MITWLKYSVYCLAIALLLITVIGAFVYAHPLGLFWAIGGGSVTSDRTVYVLPPAPAGTPARFPAILRNVSLSTVKILGVDSPCGCIEVEPMPLELGVGAEAAVIVHCHLRWPEKDSERFSVPVAFFVDDGKSVQVARVDGTIATANEQENVTRMEDIINVPEDELKPVPTS